MEGVPSTLPQFGACGSAKTSPTQNGYKSGPPRSISHSWFKFGHSGSILIAKVKERQSFRGMQNVFAMFAFNPVFVLSSAIGGIVSEGMGLRSSWCRANLGLRSGVQRDNGVYQE